MVHVRQVRVGEGIIDVLWLVTVAVKVTED